MIEETNISEALTEMFKKKTTPFPDWSAQDPLPGDSFIYDVDEFDDSNNRFSDRFMEDSYGNSDGEGY